MKKLSTLLLIALLSSCVPAHAATYHDHNIDGYNLSCSIYNPQSHSYYHNCLIVFNGLFATIYPEDGSFINVQLDQREIEDPASIHSYELNQYGNQSQYQYTIELSESVIESLNQL